MKMSNYSDLAKPALKRETRTYVKSMQNIEYLSSLVFKGLKNALLQYLGFIFHFLSLLVVNHEEGEGAGVCGMS